MSSSSSTASTPLNWILADCPACGKTMKARRETVAAGNALVCPACKAPIELQLPDAGNAPPVSTPPTPTAIRPTSPVGDDREHPVFKGAALSGPPAAPGNEFPASGPPAKSFRPSNLPPPKDRPAPQKPEDKISKPDLKQQQRLPESRRKPFDELNTIPREERRIVTAGEHELSEEFKSKLKGIDIERLRIRHRRRLGPGEVRIADWDTVLDHIPEAEIEADEWQAASPSILPEEVIPSEAREFISHGEVGGSLVKRIKRVRKSKLLQGVQLFFRRMTVGVRWTILALLALVVGTGIFWLIRAFSHKAETAEATPDAVRIMEDDALQVQLTSAGQIGAEDVAKAYFAAPTWKEKLKYVRRADAVAPLMEQWYASHSDAPQEITELVDARKGAAGKSYYIFLALRLGDSRTNKFVAVEEFLNPDKTFSYLVDWETTEGYQPMELYDYKVKQPKEPMEFRVLVTPSDYYNHGFSDKDQWQSYTLTYPGNDTFELVGYVDRKSPLYLELSQQLIVEANLILQVRYPKEAISRDQVEIEKITHKSWFYDRDEAAGKSR